MTEFSEFIPYRLKIAELFAAEQVDMEMMNGLTAVFALVDDDPIPLLQTELVFKLRDLGKAIFQKFGFFLVHFGKESEMGLGDTEVV